MFVSSIGLRYPGIHYDEVLFTNGALRVSENAFVTASIGKLPVLLMPYIGALKTYFLMPLFSVFGPSVLVMRAFNIVLMTIFLLLTYTLVMRFSNRKLATGILALLATNASIIMFGRTDFGPIAFEHIFFVLSLICVHVFLTGKDFRWLLFTFLALGLGIFNKLNFIWFINAFYFAVVVVYFMYVRKHFTKPQIKKLLIFGISFYVAAIGYYLFISRYYNMEGGLKLGSPKYIWNSMLDTLGGHWFFSLLGAPVPSRLSSVLVLAGFILIAAYLVLRARKTSKTSALFFLSGLVFLAMLGQISLTPAATAGWHYLTLQPFWAIMVGVAIYELLLPIKQNRRFVLYWLSIGIICVGQAIVFTNSRYLIKDQGSIYWSEAIYELADFAKQHEGYYIVPDWGIYTQLITLDPIKNKYSEVFGPIDSNNPTEVEAAKKNFFPSESNKPIYVVTHPEQSATFPGTQKSILEISQVFGTPQRLTTIYDDQKEVFLIYEIKR